MEFGEDFHFKLQWPKYISAEIIEKGRKVL